MGSVPSRTENPLLRRVLVESASTWGFLLSDVQISYEAFTTGIAFKILGCTGDPHNTSRYDSSPKFCIKCLDA